MHGALCVANQSVMSVKLHTPLACGCFQKRNFQSKNKNIMPKQILICHEITGDVMERYSASEHTLESAMRDFLQTYSEFVGYGRENFIARYGMKFARRRA